MREYETRAVNKGNSPASKVLRPARTGKVSRKEAVKAVRKVIKERKSHEKLAHALSFYVIGLCEEERRDYEQEILKRIRES